MNAVPIFIVCAIRDSANGAAATDCQWGSPAHVQAHHHDEARIVGGSACGVGSLSLGGTVIPGAFEIRARRPTVPSTPDIPVAIAPRAAVAPVEDRERLEHEREGGGAPSERAGKKGVSYWTHRFLHRA
jgi:hypothetical protein